MSQQLTKIENNLQGLLSKKQSALPENFNQTRFLQNCIYALSEVKDLHKIDPMSVSMTMLKGAFLGLDFFNKECYAIPYGNKLQFQTDYKGEVKLAKLYSMNPIKEIYAKLVREGDHYEVTMVNGDQQVEFTPLPFNNADIIGVFGVIMYENGTFYIDDMGVDEVERIRKTYSKAPNSKMWVHSYGEAVKKTMIRRLMKVVSLDFKNSDQDRAFKEGGDVEFDKFEEIKEDVKMPKRVQQPAIPEPTGTAINAKQLTEIANTLKEKGIKPAEFKKHLKEEYGITAFDTKSITTEQYKIIKPEPEKVKEAETKTDTKDKDFWDTPEQFKDEFEMLREAFDNHHEAMEKKGLGDFNTLLKFFAVEATALAFPPSKMFEIESFILKGKK